MVSAHPSRARRRRMAEPAVGSREISAMSDVEVARPAEASFVEALATRISTQYGAVLEEVRAYALLLLRGYDDARVRSFVPLLVEKRLREAYRPRPSAG
jgi:hypothetical protein